MPKPRVLLPATALAFLAQSVLSLGVAQEPPPPGSTLFALSTELALEERSDFESDLGAELSVPAELGPEGVGSAINLNDVPTAAELGLAPDSFAEPLSHVQGEFEQHGERGQAVIDLLTGLELEPEVSSGPDAEGESLAPGDGVSEFDGISNTGWIPPDTIHATGPNHVVMTVNSGFAVYTKLGTVARSYTTFDSFLHKPSGWNGYMFDPRIVFDPVTSQYVMLVLGKDDTNRRSYVWIAVASDPLGSWWRLRWNVTRNADTANEAWLDYAGLGVDSWGVYWTGNYFRWAGGFDTSTIQAQNPNVLSGGLGGGYFWTNLTWPSGATASALQPAHPHSINGSQQMFFVNTFNSSGSDVLLWRWSGDRYSGQGLGTRSLTRARIPLGRTYYSIGNNVDQGGTAMDLDGGDARVMNAVYQNRRVYLTLTDDVNNSGTATGAYTIKLNTDTNTKLWDTVLWAGANTYTFYPAVTVNAANPLALDPEIAVYHSYTDTRSSTATLRFASAVRKIYVNHPTDTTGPWQFYAVGEDDYQRLDSNGKNRWGDYSGAAYDWYCDSATGSMEYAGTSNIWKTWIRVEDFGNGPCPLIEVTRPNGGETLTTLAPYTVRWKRANLDPTFQIYLFFSATGGGSPRQIGGPLSTATTSFDWTPLCSDETTEGLIFVGSWDPAAQQYEVFDWSDNVFSVDCPCSPDGWEPDDSAGQANTIVNGVTQVHSICPIGDQDWVRFSLGAGEWNVVSETSGATGDTTMTLYNSAGTQIEFNDDGGAGLFSRIDRLCGADPLPGGTYYVKVDEFGNNSYIASYNLRATFEACRVCGNGVVEPGEECDDGNTTGGDCCAANCTYEAQGSPCDDGRYCNVGETCNGTGTCGGGSPRNCSDAFSCTNDTCNETTDRCEHAPINSRCDDGQFCNGTEVCNVSTGCQSGTPVNCNDGLYCTIDSCNEATDRCDHPARSCNDGLYCTIDSCNETADRCDNLARNCSDGVGCTEDSCNEATNACEYNANDANCPNDGLFCNGSEYCHPANDCSSTGNPCQSGETCDENGDICVPQQVQRITPDPLEQGTQPGGTVRVEAVYNTSPADPTLTGIGLRYHFDSSKLTFSGFEDVLASGLIVNPDLVTPEPDAGNWDGDPATDLFVRLAWLDVGGNWPGTLPQPLATAVYSSAPSFSGETHVRFSATDQPPTWGFESTPARVFEQLCTLDVDDNGDVTALTDGILTVRYLFNFTGAALVDQALGAGAQRTDPNDIIAYLDGCRSTMLDVDDNGQARALEDGIMIARYEFGFGCPALSDQAVAADANRPICTDIRDYIAGYMPLAPASPGSLGAAAALAPAVERGSQSIRSRLDRSRLGRTARARLDVVYSANDMTLTGIGLRMHFDSSRLELEDIEQMFQSGKVQHAVLEDTTDFDNDPSTDRYLAVAWADVLGRWPGGRRSQLLYSAVFRVLEGARGSTVINYTAVDTPPGFAFDAKSVKLRLGGRAR